VPTLYVSARRAPLPAAFVPMRTTAVARPPEGSGWLHEIKHDGYRMLARLEGGRARLLSRNGLDWTPRLRSVAQALEALPVREAYLDGEIVALGEDGASSFEGLQASFDGQARHPIVYFLFDVPFLDGHDLTSVPLVERKRVLKRLLARAPRPELRYTDHLRGRGETFYALCAQHRLEGVVSKRADSPYVPGGEGAWLKSKCRISQEFVVAGYTYADHPNRAGGLILGVYDGPRLTYVGGVGLALRNADRAIAQEALGQRGVERCPFGPVPKDLRNVAVRWTEPALVVQVSFTNWTAAGLIRQGLLQGFRTDKVPKDVRRETGQALRTPGVRAPEGPPRRDGAPPRRAARRGTSANVARADGPTRASM